MKMFEIQIETNTQEQEQNIHTKISKMLSDLGYLYSARNLKIREVGKGETKTLAVLGDLSYKVFLIQDLDRLALTKGELAKRMGIENLTFDYALPQGWVDEMVKKTSFPYYRITGTTFWMYVDGFGFPLSGDQQINGYLESTVYNKPPFTQGG